MGKDLKGKELGKGFSQRADGRYEARAVVKGKKIDIYDMLLTTLRKTFEIEKAKILQGESSGKKITLKDWYDEWFKTCKSPQLKSDMSRRTYDRKMRNTFVKILGDKKIADISQIDIQQAVNELQDNYNIRGLRETLSIFRTCMDIAIINKHIQVNPIVGITIHDGNEVQKKRRVLEKWEQDLFLDEIEGSYYKEAYLILLLTGMRIGEFSGLQWEDIDYNRKVIKIFRSMSTGYVYGKKIMELTTPKTSNSYREIPFFGNVEELFKSWGKKQEEYRKKLGSRWRLDASCGNLVFTTTMGSPVTKYNIAHDLQRVENNIRLKEARQAHIEGRQPREFGHLHPHCFRHTFATRCFEKGLDPVVVQSIMGHANYSTTLSYTHILGDKTKEAVNKAGNLLD